MEKSAKNIILLILSILVVATGIGCIFYFGFGGFDWGPSFNGPSNNYEPPLDDLTNHETPYKDLNEYGDYSKFTYQDVNEKAGYPITPSLGEVNIVVIPVEFEKSRPLSSVDRHMREFTEEDLNAINVAFNGESDQSGNEYWESVSSFYYESSFSKLDLNFDIVDPFTPEISASEFVEYERHGETGIEGSSEILREVFSEGLTMNGEPIDLLSNRYDINNDDYIDGIWMIYNCFDTEYVESKTQPFWAYTTNYVSNSDYSTRYANCALSFLYNDSPKGYDAHTLIHETGHMLGLDDYYSYENDYNFGYLGGIDMMDLNIGDHNAFSKYALGWTKPQIVYEKESTITLRPSATSGDFAIIPSSYFNDSAFGEYLLLEYKTRDGLNALDGNKSYRGGYPLTFDNGLAIYHVDARLALHSITQSGRYYIDSYLDVEDDEIPSASYDYEKDEYKTYLVANSNTPGYNAIDEDYALIKLVSRSRTLYREREDGDVSNEGLTNVDLYKEGNSFGSKQFERYFSEGYFNNGTPINNVSIEVTSMTHEKIKLFIKR